MIFAALVYTSLGSTARNRTSAEMQAGFHSNILLVSEAAARVYGLPLHELKLCRRGLGVPWDFRVSFGMRSTTLEDVHLTAGTGCGQEDMIMSC